MKLFITILLIASIIGIAAVSLLVMDHNGNCVVSYAAGMACSQLNPLAYIGIHVGFLRSFSEAFLVVILSIIFGLVVFASLVFCFKNFHLNKVFSNAEFLLKAYNGYNRRQTCWLSLFENSPNAL